MIIKVSCLLIINVVVGGHTKKYSIIQCNATFSYLRL